MLWHYRQGDSRWTHGIVMHGLMCGYEGGLEVVVASGVVVAVEVRKVAAGDVKSDAVPSLEQIAGGMDLN